MQLTVIALVAGLVLGFSSGWKTNGWRYHAAELERSQVEARDQVKKMERNDEAAGAHEEMKAKTEVVYVDRIKRVDRIVERPVYRNACFDGDGLSELNAAIAGDVAPSKPTAKVP